MKLAMIYLTLINYTKNIQQYKIKQKIWKEIKMETNIVSVKYEDRYTPKTFSGRAYSYITTIPLEVGDLVVAPTSYGEKIARVSEINVPESKVLLIKPMLKLITDKIDKKKYLQENQIHKEAA